MHLGSLASPIEPITNRTPIITKNIVSPCPNEFFLILIVLPFRCLQTLGRIHKVACEKFTFHTSLLCKKLSQNHNHPDENTQIYDSNTYVKEYTYLGIVGECNDKGLYHIEQRNKFSVGETIEVMRPDGTNLEVTVKAIYNEDGEAMESAPHPKQQLYIDLGVPLCQYDILRRKED